jgi:hypothetical protein
MAEVAESPERAEVAWNGGEGAEVAESPERAEVAWNGEERAEVAENSGAVA